MMTCVIVRLITALEDSPLLLVRYGLDLVLVMMFVLIYTLRCLIRLLVRLRDTRKGPLLMRPMTAKLLAALWCRSTLLTTAPFTM